MIFRAHSSTTGRIKGNQNLKPETAWIYGRIICKNFTAGLTGDYYVNSFGWKSTSFWKWNETKNYPLEVMWGGSSEKYSNRGE